jgi:hypothetical protein
LHHDHHLDPLTSLLFSLSFRPFLLHLFHPLHPLLELSVREGKPDVTRTGTEEDVAQVSVTEGCDFGGGGSEEGRFEAPKDETDTESATEGEGEKEQAQALERLSHL